MKTLTTLILVAVLIAAALPADAGDYLESGEIGAIGAGTIGLVMMGRYLGALGADQPPRWTEPPGFDRWVTEHLAPEPRPRPRNFMDSDRAAVLNVLLTGTAVAALDMEYPSGDRGKDVMQGQFLYYAGLLSMQGIQDSVKGTVARQRPLARLAPGVAAQREDIDSARDQRSFWSGHTSAAFYGSTFLNKRVRAVMRSELGGGDYDRWSWAPPTVLYGWAAWVAYSRIHGYQHYLSDVSVGAVAGWLAAEIFYSLDDRNRRGNGPDKVAPMLSFSFTF
jgi:PAP2 superfamily